MPQVVCRFAKGEAIRYISHLDLMRAMERGIRRARLPVAHSEGFNPRPRVSYASALSVGHTSEAELMAVTLIAPLDPTDVRQMLNDSLPEGLQILQAWGTPPHQPKTSLGDIDTAEYVVRVHGPLGECDLAARAAEFMAQTELWITRERQKSTKDMDLRALVDEVELLHADAETAEVRLRVRTGSAGGAKPEEVLAALGVAGRGFRLAVHRTALYAGASGPRRDRRRLHRLLGRE